MAGLPIRRLVTMFSPGGSPVGARSPGLSGGRLVGAAPFWRLPAYGQRLPYCDRTWGVAWWRSLPWFRWGSPRGRALPFSSCQLEASSTNCRGCLVGASLHLIEPGGSPVGARSPGFSGGRHVGAAPFLAPAGVWPTAARWVCSQCGGSPCRRSRPGRPAGVWPAAATMENTSFVGGAM